MPMETARGIIQIESGKNYYWRALGPSRLIPRDRICEYEEEKRSREAEDAGAGERERSKRPKRRGSKVIEKREVGKKGAMRAGEAVREETAGRVR